MQDFRTQIAPECLMSVDGRPQFGHFDGIISSLGLEHFAYFDVMDKPASRLAKHFHFKQFQFVSLVTPNYVIGVALADIRYVGSAFCYLYDIKADKLTEVAWLKPPGMGYAMTPSPLTGRSHICSGKGEIILDISHGQWRLTLNTARIRAELELQAPRLSLPLAMCSPTAYNGWTYTQKHNGLSPKGQLFIDDEPQPLNRALAGYDFSAGYMRRQTSWRWASVNASIAEGVLGLNLAAGVNETGMTENVFWINGERHLLGPVHFEFDRHRAAQEPGAAAQEWHIFSDDGRVELYFSPCNCRSEKLNLWLLKSNFRQYLGHYRGRLTDTNGREYRLDRVLGLSEDHYALW
ncbi:DUF2804 domain-containing protein [Shewanella sp. AS16]|uniref:DUF2804 domain-containing protein n=1 Tax=Shewanella sp. AS16 TaxID=2907625 RepID=UPI001F1B06F1|nr:DUF2804 domain-containing protein [Shewanella sp. AS16]MCE9686317.1 DUF2804 domain-containing protein [Shewanella sp. AS16]